MRSIWTDSLGFGLVNNISKYHNEYKMELMKIIRSKATGKKATPAKKLQVAYTAKDDLFGQLKASLAKPSRKKAS